MLELGLTLIDKFIRLLTERRTAVAEMIQDRRRVIQDVVDPLAREMEVIFRNYHTILGEVESRLSDPDTDPSAVIRELRKLREELEPLRVKVRVMAAVFLGDSGNWKREPEDISLLRDFALETGGVFAAFAWVGIKTDPDERARIFFDSSLTWRLLRTLEYTVESSESHEEWRKEGLHNISLLRLALKLRWENFVNAYARLRTRFLLAR